MANLETRQQRACVQASVVGAVTTSHLTSLDLEMDTPMAELRWILNSQVLQELHLRDVATSFFADEIAALSLSVCPNLCALTVAYCYRSQPIDLPNASIFIVLPNLTVFGMEGNNVEVTTIDALEFLRALPGGIKQLSLGITFVEPVEVFCALLSASNLCGLEEVSEFMVSFAYAFLL